MGYERKPWPTNQKKPIVLTSERSTVTSNRRRTAARSACAMGDTWVHLRLCMSCGHVGCCDDSKNKHATKHFHATRSTPSSARSSRARSGAGATSTSSSSSLCPSPAGRRYSSTQRAVHELDADGALAHGGGDALDAARAHVAHGEDAGPVGLEEERRARQRPARASAARRREVGAGLHEALVVERHARLEPAGVRRRRRSSGRRGRWGRPRWRPVGCRAADPLAAGRRPRARRSRCACGA